MHHVKPSVKGDPLCPLGFHPQVRWPTRCKRCYRDHKDHSNRNKDISKSSLRKDDTTLSTPALNNESTNESTDSKNVSSHLMSDNSQNDFKVNKGEPSIRKTTSWTSTPDLTMLSDNVTSQVNKLKDDDDQSIPEFTVRRRTNLSRSDSMDMHSPRNSYNGDIVQYTPVHTQSIPEDKNLDDDDDDTISLADSDATTDTFATVINDEDLHDQVVHLKAELKLMKAKCDKAEREKSDILLRRLASLDTTPTSRTTASELLKHQQKVNDLKSTCESLNDEKRKLTQRVCELEMEINKNKNSKVKSDDVQLVHSKLIAAETKIEELMEENNDLNKEIRNMEQEMRDNFREELDNEFIMLRREFDQVSKNCRILAFKLKKAERRMEELDKEKIETDKKNKELIERLQSELEKSTSSQGDQKKRPMLGMIPKSASGERVSRESLTRGDSQEDPVQLQRDLQDSIEREADMREQLRFSEEEAKILRSKVSRLEEDNESMVLQLKKMATKSNYRPTNITDRDEGISDVEDATELKLLLELSEQEITVLKRKIEEFEVEKNQLKAKVVDYQTKLASKSTYKPLSKPIQNKTKEVKADFDKQTKAVKQLEAKTIDLESQLTSERQQIENIKSLHKKELTTKEEYIKKLQEKSTIEENKKIMDVQSEFEKKIKRIENELMNERKNYKDILNKYEILQKEQLDAKSKLTAEKEKIQSLLESKKKETSKVELELKTLKEKYNNAFDVWNKQKLEMQKKLKDLEKAHSNDVWVIEKENMKRNLDEYMKEINILNKQCSQYVEQIEKLKKDNENLQNNLDDFEKVVKVQHSRSVETELLDKNVKDLKIKLYNEEQARKVEVAALKARYDNRMSVLSEELKNSQFQTLRFKRERDSYKQILDTADSIPKKGNLNKVQNIDSQKEEIHVLQQQVSCMEEQLSEARLECSRLKTELVSEKSAWEITKSEMTSSINKLEEERLLNSGRSKLAGLKGRMELAWQKEREEQQRLLQETSTLARDLRQTLYEVEREKDKDRLESKRRIDQLTKNMEVDQQENRKKTNEMQCDLMDLRDAHAKLRTINEKLRKEKDKIEQECESLRLCNVRMRTDPQVEVKINNLSQLIKSLTMMFNENHELTNKPVNSLNAPTPPARRKSSISREASPDLNSNQVLNNNNNEQIKQILNKVNEITKELVINTNQPDVRSKRAVFGVRSSSTENDFNDKPPIRGSLYRKSLSLEQNFGNTEQDIWKRDERSQSRNRLIKQPNSFDSQQSNSSSKSDIVSGEKSKKKGLFGKLKKLTKSSKSFDNDSDLSYKSSSSIHNVDTSSNKESKGKLTDVFKPSTLPNLKKRAMSPSLFRRSDNSRTSSSLSTKSDEYEEIS